MGDMGDMYREWDAAKKEKKQRREQRNREIIEVWLQKNPAAHRYVHYYINGTFQFHLLGKPKIDFYPTTNKWRKGKVIYYGDAAKFLEWYEKQ